MLIILKLILEHDVVEYLRRHVLWSGHGELFQVCEQEAGAEVDEFELLDIGALGLEFALDLDQDVLGFEV